MSSSYQKPAGVKSYLDFINSPDGEIFKQVLSKKLLKRLPEKANLSILDAGCGNGWLTKLLRAKNFRVLGCDISEDLLSLAKKLCPGTEFIHTDLNLPLPFQNNQFDTAIFNVSLLDIANIKTTAEEMHRLVKDKVIIMAVNPYYGFPVGKWKRSFWGKIFRLKPTLSLQPYCNFAKSADRSFNWHQGHLTSFFHTLPEQINAFTQAGFHLNYLQDIFMEKKSDTYNLAYRLNQFPIFILLEFTKN